MSRVNFTLFDDNRSIYQSDVPEAEGNLLAFSGVLDQAINVEDVQTERTLWISAGSRDGEFTVTIDYLLSGVQVFTVIPGRPLVMETLPRSVDEIQSVVIAPSGTGATVEVLVYPGIAEEPPLVPIDAVLVLNAASGVEVSDGVVDSWRDIRPGSGAPGAFLPVSDDGPVLFPSNPDFDGQPTVTMDFVDMRLVSEDAPSVFDFLGTGPFTIAMVCSYQDKGAEQQGVSNSSASDGGFMMGVEGGFRTIHQLTDDAGTPNNEGTGAEELAPPPVDELARAFTHIIRYDGTTLEVYRQGETTETENIGAAATAVVEALHIGGSPGGDGLCSMSIADLRIWDRRLTNLEHADYIIFGQDQYAVDDEGAAQPPLEDLEYRLRANRGIVNVSGEVTNWGDTRPEAFAGSFEVTADKLAPLFIGQDENFGSRPAVDFTGDSPDMKGLTYSGDVTDFGFLCGLTSGFTICLILMVTNNETNQRQIIQQSVGVSPGINWNNSSDGAGSTCSISDSAGATINFFTTPTTSLPFDVPRAGFYFGNSAVPIEETSTVYRGTTAMVEGGSPMNSPQDSETPTEPVTLGAVNGQDNSASFELVEAFFYSRSLNQFDRNAMMTYVASRYEISEP